MIFPTTMGAVLSRGSRILGCLATDRLLSIRALCLVSAVRLGLWLLPVRTVGRLLGWFVPRMPGGIPDPSVPDRVARAVTRASRVVPGATCLTQALAAQVFLERQGLPTRLHIGIRGGGQAMRAHAWLDTQETTVIGGALAGQWTPLLTVEGTRAWSTLGERSW
jgi:transglutaminase superfamily protein